MQLHSNTLKRMSLVPFFIIAPAIALYSIFVIFPMLRTIQLSFFEWNGIFGSKKYFTGLENYIFMFQDPDFLRSIKNSIIFMAGGFIIQCPISLILGMLITSKIKGIRFFKTTYFLPVILPLTAIGLMWTFIFYPNGGPLNTLLEAIGLKNLAGLWFADQNLAIYCVLVVREWFHTGLYMLIFAAGIVAISGDLYQAAEIDGANGLKRTLYITIPMLKETYKTLSILIITGAFKVFDIIFVTTNGGPAGATETPATMIYHQAYIYGKFGYGNAIGAFLLLTALLLSLLFSRLSSESRT